ncbi:hypothetical protein BDQ17DRAFT_1333709 [Cyathus striatus]|nr:hypothetical protein BDQ17DRAFT_1333709 [Cyathus striatus]
MPSSEEKNLSKAIFSRISQFTGLQVLRLHFHPTFEECLDEQLVFGRPNASSYLNLQILAVRPEQLYTLEITNLLAMPPRFIDNLYDPESSYLVSFLNPIQNLSISILSDPGLRSLTADDALDFWIYSLPIILQAASNTMVLKISTNDVEASTLTGWNEISMPSLTSLTLEGIMFTGKPDGVEAFICHHGLSALSISGCSVTNNSYHEPYRSWSDVYFTLGQRNLFYLNIDVNRDRHSLMLENGFSDERTWMSYYLDIGGTIELHTEPILGEECDSIMLDMLMAPQLPPIPTVISRL